MIIIADTIADRILIELQSWGKLSPADRTRAVDNIRRYELEIEKLNSRLELESATLKRKFIMNIERQIQDAEWHLRIWQTRLEMRG